jgi:hypothetical protein
VAQMNDKVFFEKEINVFSSKKILDIPTQNLQMGIVRITLFDKNGTPRNERIAFVNRHKSLNISVKTNKEKYLPREKVSMNIKITDDKGQPVKGNFSLSVADDQQLTFADDKQGNILASLLLESELQGKIEEPNFYFDTKEDKSLEALDYLMLTQGWRNFEWKNVLSEKDVAAEYEFENETIAVVGKVLNRESRMPVAYYPCTLFPSKKIYLTDSEGIIHFKKSDVKNQTKIKFGTQNSFPIAFDVKDSFIVKIQTRGGNGFVHGLTDKRIRKLSQYKNQSSKNDYDSETSNLSGYIKDWDNKDVLIGANIFIKNEDQDVGILVTDIDGFYSIDLEPGKYDIEINYTGYDVLKKTRKIIEKGKNKSIDFYLKSSKALEEVIVTGYGTIKKQEKIGIKDNVKSTTFDFDEKVKKNLNIPNFSEDEIIKDIGVGNVSLPLKTKENGSNTNINVNIEGNIGERIRLPKQDNTTSGYIVTSEQIARMPSRNISAITPGVSSEDGSETTRIKGSRGEGTVYMVDGVRVNAGSLPPAQEIEQLQVITRGVPAQFADFEELKILESIPVSGYGVQSKSNTTGSVKDIIAGKISGLEILSNINAPVLSGVPIDMTAECSVSYSNIYTTTRTFYTPKYDNQETVETRTDFRNTIFWKPDVTTNEKGEANVEFYNSDALTTFRATIEGIGEKGTIGRNEYRYATQQALSLSAKVPDKVLTNDIVRIPLTLKNNSDKELAGKLSVLVPSNFEAIGTIPTVLTLKANETQTVFLPYKVKAQSAAILGENQQFTIEFQAKNAKDRFTTNIKTLSRGFPVTQLFTANQLKNDFKIELQSPVENTAKLTFTAYPNALDDVLGGMERMLQQPSGCFEQVSSTNYPNLLVLDLLRNTQQVRPDVEKQAMAFLADGYKRLTAYECKSGGYDWWGRDPAHEGLTAYGVLEFTDMAKVFDVDKKMIERSVNWLLSRRDNKGGWTLNPQNSHGWQSDNILNAYICYALAEAGYGAAISAEIEAVYKAELGKNDAYTQALLANTMFAIGDKKRANLLINNILQQKTQDGSFTGTSHSVFHAYGKGFTIETTSLLALALMKSGENENVLAKAINYIAQSKSEYGYGNTQSTVMALKALCAYTQKQQNQATAGTINILVNDKIVATKNYGKNQFGKVQIAGLESFITTEKNNVKVVFEGTDQAIPFDLEMKYASKMPQNAKESPLTFSTILSKNQVKIGETVRLSAALSNKTNKTVASPIMLVGIPAGLTAQPWQLKQIVDRKECAFYEIFNNYIVFYFDEFQANALKTIQLDLRSDVSGSYESPASVAYPYYTNEWRVWSQPKEIEIQ